MGYCCSRCGGLGGLFESSHLHSDPDSCFAELAEEKKRLLFQIETLKNEIGGRSRITEKVQYDLEAMTRHANEGWKLANERTGQWKEMERLISEMIVRTMEFRVGELEAKDIPKYIAAFVRTFVDDFTEKRKGIREIAEGLGMKVQDSKDEPPDFPKGPYPEDLQR